MHFSKIIIFLISIIITILTLGLTTSSGENNLLSSKIGFNNDNNTIFYVNTHHEQVGPETIFANSNIIDKKNGDFNIADKLIEEKLKEQLVKFQNNFNYEKSFMQRVEDYLPKTAKELAESKIFIGNVRVLTNELKTLKFKYITKSKKQLVDFIEKVQAENSYLPQNKKTILKQLCVNEEESNDIYQYHYGNKEILFVENKYDCFYRFIKCDDLTIPNVDIFIEKWLPAQLTSDLCVKNYIRANTEIPWRAFSYDKNKQSLISKTAYYVTDTFFTYHGADIIVYPLGKNELNLLVENGLFETFSGTLTNFEKLVDYYSTVIYLQKMYTPNPLCSKITNILINSFDKSGYLNLSESNNYFANMDERNICKIKTALKVDPIFNFEFSGCIETITNTFYRIINNIWKDNGMNAIFSHEKGIQAIKSLLSFMNDGKNNLFNLMIYLPQNFDIEKYIKQYTLNKIEINYGEKNQIIISKILQKIDNKEENEYPAVIDFLNFIFVENANIIDVTKKKVIKEYLKTISDVEMQKYVTENCLSYENKAFLVVVDKSRNMTDNFNKNLKDELFYSSAFKSFNTSTRVYKFKDDPSEYNVLFLIRNGTDFN